MDSKSVSVKRRLIGAIFVTGIIALALACVVLLAYELRSYRNATARSLQTIAQIIAENSSAVLIYDDRELAAEILSGLRVESEISGAVLYDKAGQTYASYPSGTVNGFPARPGPDGVSIRSNEISVFEPVLQGSTRVGTLYLKGSLRGTYQRLRVYGLVLLGVLLAAGGLALIVSNFLQRRISEPLAALAKTARAVSEDHDYSVRATQVSNDEFGDLTAALNKMLDEIQISNTALREGEERFRALADKGRRRAVSRARRQHCATRVDGGRGRSIQVVQQAMV
jgi:methyl-accepting chemotaxis protein